MLSKIKVIRLRGRVRSQVTQVFNLLSHLVLQHLLLIKNFKSHRFSRLRVPCKFHLCKCTFTNGPPHLVFTNSAFNLRLTHSLHLNFCALIRSLPEMHIRIQFLTILSTSQREKKTYIQILCDVCLLFRKCYYCLWFKPRVNSVYTATIKNFHKIIQLQTTKEDEFLIG